MATLTAGLPTADSIGAAVFAELEAQVAANQEVSPELLNSLSLLYGPKTLSKAAELVDAGGIVCYEAEVSGRRVYQVPGSKAGDQYVVFPAHYCACHAFQYDVVLQSQAVCCKHQLAARLAAAMRRAQVVRVPDLTLAHMLLQHCS